MTSEIMLAFKSRSSDQYHNGAIGGVIHPTWKWRRDLPPDECHAASPAPYRSTYATPLWPLETRNRAVPNMRSESSRIEALPVEVPR